MKITNQGFTLIELVMVIVILGILAAAAIPKFVDLSSEARISGVKALAGSVSTGAMLARSKAIIDGVDVSSGGVVAHDLDSDGTPESLIFGYPNSNNAHTMTWIVDDIGDFTYNSGDPGTYELDTNCLVQYQNAPDANNGPSITTVTSGC